MEEPFEVSDQLHSADAISQRVRHLARTLVVTSPKASHLQSEQSLEREGVDPEVLAGLSNAELQNLEDLITALASICRLLIRLGDSNSLHLALNLSHKLYELERALPEVSHRSSLYKGISQIGLSKTAIGIRNVLIGLTPSRSTALLAEESCFGYRALMSAAIVNRNIRLALKYGEEWLRTAAGAGLPWEMCHSKMAMHILHLLLQDVAWCTTNIQALTADAPSAWQGVVTFLGQWTQRLNGSSTYPYTGFSEPYPLYLGFDWYAVEAALDAISAADFKQLCSLVRSYPNRAAIADRFSTGQLINYAALLARWELLKPFREVESLLQDQTPDAHFKFNITRILSRHVLDYVVNAKPTEADIRPLPKTLVWMMDVRDFSKFSREYRPESIFEILSPLYRIMHEELESAGGTIHEFAGDSIMVVFNTGNRQAEDGRDADIVEILSRTVRCLRQIHVLNALYLPAGMPELRIGVEINKGPAAMGYLGGLSRCHLAVLGNTVNVAARIEQQTKEAPGTVLVSRSCFDGKEPDVWNTPLRVNFALRDVGQLLMKNISSIPPLFSVKPLLRYWVDFVPLGHVARPEKGVVYIDAGNAVEPGIIDHHCPGHGAGSACQLLLQKPQLLLGHLQGVPSAQIEFRLHQQPDLDCAATLYAAYELMDKEPRQDILQKLADYVNLIDQGNIPQPEMVADSLYGILVAHQKLVEQTFGADTTDAMRLEAGLRVIDAACYLMERSKQHGDFAYIFRFEPDWFSEERRLIKTDRAHYDDDWESRSHRYRARVRGRSTAVEGLWLDHPQSILFKFWARTDQRADGGEGYAFLTVDWSDLKKDKNRFVISVAPETGTDLKGLGEFLEREEAAKRKKLGKPRPRHPIRYPADNSDPWYFGWSHNFTIVDSPRAGTILTAEEVQQIHEAWPEEG